MKAQPSEPQWGPGRDLDPPGWLRCRYSILRHALQYHRIQIAIMVLALVLLIELVLKWDVLRLPMNFQNSTSLVIEVLRDIIGVLSSPIQYQNATTLSSASPSNLADWWIRVQSLLGIGTLLVAIFVWYGEIREDWEKRLPKRMSVFFLHKGWPVIVCRYIWLAGEGDLRAWGQQVAAQAACERYLNFYPNLKAQDPRLAVWIDGMICRHYVLCFELTDENPFLAKYLGMVRYQNIATDSNIVFTVPLADLKKKVPASVFPFDWPDEAFNTQTQTTLLMYSGKEK